ncbi:MAG: aminoglycoside 6-adenylyltransferase, partial [Bacteroidia bacterium]|nr:aminoglycoside 6-adenylyltransferase [Bacteroidia bacterium]
NEFWWLCPYVAKAIVRGEIMHAKEIMENPLRNMFNQMIDICIGTGTKFSVTSGKGGKFRKQYLADEEYRKIIKTYPAYEVQEIEESMIIMMDIFSDYSSKVSLELGFKYDKNEEHNSRQYYKSILY